MRLPDLKIHCRFLYTKRCSFELCKSEVHISLTFHFYSFKIISCILITLIQNSFSLCIPHFNERNKIYENFIKNYSTENKKII